MRRPVPAFVGVLIALGLAAAPAGADVDGPRTVRPGERVTFTLTDMHPDSVLTVRLQRVPCGGNGGCGGRAIYGPRSTDGYYRSDARGDATVAFRWPRRWVDCVNAALPETCHYARWGRGKRVRFSVCDESQQGPCQRRLVRIR